MPKADLNKFLLSKKSPLKFNQKQRLKAQMRYEKAGIETTKIKRMKNNQ